MKTRPRKPTTAGRQRAAAPSHRVADLWGVVLLALGITIGIALWTADAGLFGSAIGSFFQLLFGVGSWGVAAYAALLGIGFIAGKRHSDRLRLGWGLGLLFFALLGAIARAGQGDYFDPIVAGESGGLVGAVIGWALEALLGKAKPVGLGALGMVGLVLCFQMPLHAILGALAERAQALKLKPKKQAGKVPARPTKRPFESRAVAQVPESESDEQPTERPKPKPVIRDLEQPTLGIETDLGPKEGYTLPPLSLLDEPKPRPTRSPQEMSQNIQILESTLEEFGIEANVVEVATGPTITRYEVQLGPGIKVNRIVALADNMAMNMAASHVRVEAPIPGKAAIGVEVPNAHRSSIALREMLDTKDFRDHASRLCIALGQDVGGANRFTDLSKMPHLLIGGATNSGKSIGLASLIMALVMRNTPKDVRLVLVDPKRVEFTLFEGLPHLMCPVVKDVKQTPGVLRALWREMDRRYDVFSDAGVRNIEGWNGKASFQEKMPYIVLVIDELADLMIQAAAEVETSIARLAQLARATGIHLVVATQRPSVDVITGTIKANISSRIAFSVTSQIDSRTILDSAGAEKLIGMGDMLFMPIDASKPSRIQGCYVSEKEIERVVGHWKEQEKPHYAIDPAAFSASEGQRDGGTRGGDDEGPDALWEDTVRWVVNRGEASTSMLQRKFSIGFQRASRLLDTMEERGIVGPRDGPRPREVLISASEVEGYLSGVPMRYDTGPTPDDEDFGA
ncbi:MAG: DNA translocase FtsK 4TM domain-containing protein [Armatimonadetes bacterium]|nr:DNA translocase FtsK 4TM domain-containing protein [Armatimonadota bacterium]